jgi:hypothetical protein
VQLVDPAQSERGNRGYDLCFYESEEPPVTTVVTNGLRFQAITAMRLEELVCSLRSDQKHVTHHIVDSLASLVLQNQRGMEYWTLFENDEPIVLETEIFGVIGHISPVLDLTPSVGELPARAPWPGADGIEGSAEVVG